VRAVQEGDHVLFNPEDLYEVEVRAETFIILRERDIHAVAAERLEEGHDRPVPVTGVRSAMGGRAGFRLRRGAAPTMASMADSPAVTPIASSRDDDLAQVRYDADGLVAAIVQDIAPVKC
jgi:hypothetical protein